MDSPFLLSDLMRFPSRPFSILLSDLMRFPFRPFPEKNSEINNDDIHTKGCPKTKKNLKSGW